VIIAVSSGNDHDIDRSSSAASIIDRVAKNQGKEDTSANEFSKHVQQEHAKVQAALKELKDKM
jgi:hypothetical protein